MPFRVILKWLPKQLPSAQQKARRKIYLRILCIQISFNFIESMAHRNMSTRFLPPPRFVSYEKAFFFALMFIFIYMNVRFEFVRFFFYQIFLSEKEKKTHTYFFALPSVSLRVAACHWVLSSFFSVCWHNLFYLTDVIAIEKGGRVRISHHANYVHIFFDVNAMVLILMLSLIRSICLCFPIKRSCHRTECE